MKKHLGLLFLLLAQNIGAGELTTRLSSKMLADLLPETYKKCQLVARYLDKYPNGTNDYEKNKIELFFKNISMESKVLTYCIDKHRLNFNMLPPKVKKTIFMYAYMKMFGVIMLGRTI